MMYIVRRARDGRIVSGIFYHIKTHEEATAIASRFAYNEGEDFVVETA